MTTFDDREHAFEAHFAFEATLDFQVRARRDRLVAEWAGGLMGLNDQALERYVASVVHADLSAASGAELYQKVLSDLADGGVAVQPQDVRRQVETLTAEAQRQIGVDTGADRMSASDAAG